MNNQIVSRIKEFMDYKSLNSLSLAKELGYNSSEKLSRLFRDGNAKPSYDIIYDISNKFEINTDWLITGRGTMLRSNQDQPAFSQTTQPISIDDSFLYKMYKEKELENKELTTKMLQMAEEIGNLKAQLDNQNRFTERPSVIEKISDAFTPDSFVGNGDTGEESAHMRKSTSSAKPLHGKI